MRYDQDRYGRIVGVLTVDGINVNESLIKEGYAWQYRKYCKINFCNKWLKYEDDARSAGKGLWKDSDPIAPWLWRKGTRTSTYSKSTNGRHANTSGGYHGNVKSHVFHDSSCRHYNCKNCKRSFSGRSDALKAGYRPCGGCNP